MSNPDALFRAWQKVRSNNGAPGGDGQTVAAFAEEAPILLAELHHELISGTYQPRAIRRVEIPKQDGGRRTLAIPSVRDRIVQSALAAHLSDELDAGFSEASFAYRPGRSVEQAVRRVSGAYRDGFTHVVEVDIATFFDRIPHTKLKARLAKYIADARVRKLIAGWLPGFGRDGRGVAQGSPLSPFLANLYLDGFDDAMAEAKGLRLIRFADDFVVLARSELAAEEALDRVVHLLNRLGLEAHPDKTRVVTFERGFRFLGHLFVRSLTLPEEEEAPASPAEPSDRRAPKQLVVDIPDAPEEGADWEDDPVLARQLQRARARLAKKQKRSLPEPVSARLPAVVEAESEQEMPPDDLALRLRVLYLVGAEKRLEAQNGAFSLIDPATKAEARLPLGLVDRIEVHPAAGLSDEAFRLALSAGISVAHVDGHGETVGLSLPQSALRRGSRHMAQAQARLDEEKRLAWAKILVAGRLKSQRALLKRLEQRRPGQVDEKTFKTLAWNHRRVPHEPTVAHVMGIEGNGARLYWPLLGRYLQHGWRLSRRTRRPATDPVNAVLSFLSALVYRDISALCLRHGLHPDFGLLHAAGDENQGAASDLIEEFRAPLIEALTLRLFNTRALRQPMFYADKSDGSVRLLPAGRVAVVRAYESRVARSVKSAITGHRTTWRGVMEDQINAYAAVLEGRRDEYVPYDLDF